MRLALVFVLFLAACGERTQRTAAESRADSVARAPARSQAQPSNDSVPAPAGPDGGDTPVSSEDVASGAAGVNASPPPRPAPGQPAPSQPPASEPPTANDAAVILRRAAAAYENVRALRADFVMLYENTLLRQKTTSRGTLYQRQPDRIALRFSEPAGDLLIGDGQNFYWYLPSVDAKQVLCTPAAGGGGGGGIDLQAQFVGNPVERFQATLHANESVDGRPANVLTLIPRQRAEYRSLKVWLDTRDSLARRFEIMEQNGIVRRFDLDNMTVNPSIPDATFRFVRPETARIVGCQ